MVSKTFKAEIITGATSVKERERLYKAFREGEVKLLIVSKVANFAIDLPHPRTLDMKTHERFGEYTRRIYKLLGME